MRRESPAILTLRELRPEDMHARAKREGIKKIRDPHHLLAKLFAMGYSTGEAAEQAGYSIARASTLRGDPAFSELVEQYRGMITEKQLDSVDEYYSTINRVRTKTARMIEEKLDAIDESVEGVAGVTLRELTMIHSDAADRTGYPKRTMAVNVNVDFAARLDQAIAASNKAKELNPVERSLPSPVVAPGSGGGLEDRPALPRVIEHEKV